MKPSAKKKKPGLSPATRFYTATIGVLAATTVLLQMAAMGPLRDSFWGFHLFAFLPWIVGVLAWILLALAALLWLRPSTHQETDNPRIPLLIDRPVVTAIILVVVCAVVGGWPQPQQRVVRE